MIDVILLYVDLMEQIIMDELKNLIQFANCYDDYKSGADELFMIERGVYSQY